MSQIINLQLTEQDIDVNVIFSNYKYALSEHEPIALSNGLWLHSYKVTKYYECEFFADEDIEQDSFDNEMYN